jgi:hypothetical protein
VADAAVQGVRSLASATDVDAARESWVFEHRKEPLLPRVAFLARLGRSALTAIGVVVVAWGIGTLGYRYFEGLPWIDALLNAAMILSGMGPVTELRTTGAKVFAALYAIFSGFVFLTVAAVLLGPVLHRMIHRFHLEADEEAGQKQDNS